MREVMDGHAKDIYRPGIIIGGKARVTGSRDGEQAQPDRQVT